MEVVIWFCRRCGNFYGSSTAGDLSSTMNTDAKGAPTFPRSHCPDCRQRGVESDREPVSMVPR